MAMSSYSQPREEIPNLWELMPDELKWSWCNNDRNRVHNACNSVESSRNHPLPPPQSMEKIVFHKTSPWCRKGWGPLVCSDVIVQEENTVRQDRRAIGSRHLESYYFPNLLACLDHTESPRTVIPSPQFTPCRSTPVTASGQLLSLHWLPATSLALRPYSHPTLHTMNTDLLISSQRFHACACFHAFVQCCPVNLPSSFSSAYPNLTILCSSSWIFSPTLNTVNEP